MKWFLLIFLLPMASALAGLTWNTTEVHLEAASTDKTATGVFPFTNKTANSITITETKSSCGCTTAKLEKKTYAPNESGEIVALFDLGNRVGQQQKTIKVFTDDSKEKPVVLILNVNIPDPVETSEASLTWKIGETNSEKIFTVRAKEGFKINVTDIRCSNGFFTAKVDSAKQDSTYQIAVTPVKTDAKVFGLLIVTTDYPADNPRVIYAQLKVQ